MSPAASVSGFYFSHPDARYFAVGKIGEDQLADLATRKGMPVEKALGILESEQDEGQFDPQLIRLFIAMVREELAVGERAKVARGQRRQG